MKTLRRYLLPAILTGCAALTLGLLLWPQPEAAPTPPQPRERYAGPAFTPRPATRLAGFPLSLGAAQTEPVAPAAELPTLVGIAGSSAYLKSADGDIIRARPGEEIDGLKLISVRGRTAVLRGPAGDYSLDLFTQQPADAAAPPAL